MSRSLSLAFCSFLSSSFFSVWMGPAVYICFPMNGMLKRLLSTNFSNWILYIFFGSFLLLLYFRIRNGSRSSSLFRFDFLVCAGSGPFHVLVKNTLCRQSQYCSPMFHILYKDHWMVNAGAWMNVLYILLFLRHFTTLWCHIFVLFQVSSMKWGFCSFFHFFFEFDFYRLFDIRKKRVIFLEITLM